MRNPKSEIRNPKEARNPKSETTRLTGARTFLSACWAGGGGWADRNVRAPWLAAGLMLLATPFLASAQSGIPAAINYQGKLTDSLGRPVTNGYYEVWFRIWDHPTQAGDGNYFWGRSFPLHVVTNGMFNVLLTDAGSPVTTPGAPQVTSLLQAFEGADRYLGLSVARNPAGPVTAPVEISPRQQLVSAPFTIHAYQASLADHATYSVNAGDATNASYAVNAGYATNANAAARATNADNATKFSNLTTNDFLSVNKASQTLNGALTITNADLTLKRGVTGGSLTVGSSLVVTGATTLSGTVSLAANKAITLADSKPIKIRRYGPLTKGTDSVYFTPSDANYSTNDWSATIAGFTCGGDFQEKDSGDHLIDAAMQKNPATGNWWIEFWVRNDSIKDIYVDVMWIRRELTDDNR